MTHSASLKAALTEVAHIAREPWLMLAISNLRQWFAANSAPPIPHAIRVSVGFPGGGGKRTLGECWYEGASADNHRHIFIHPKLDDPVTVLATLAHELAHAGLPASVGHRGRFVTAIRAIGLDGLPTATVAGETFIEWAEECLATMPPYPHGAVDPGAPTKSKTYLLKVGCIDCNHHFRTSLTQIEKGMPRCPFCSLPWEMFPTWA